MALAVTEDRLATLEQRVTTLWDVAERNNTMLLRLAVALDQMNEFMLLLTPHPKRLDS